MLGVPGPVVGALKRSKLGLCCLFLGGGHETSTGATYAPAAALPHSLRSALIMERESGVGRRAFFNKITKPVFSEQESKVFAAVSQRGDALGMGGLPPTRSSLRSWVGEVAAVFPAPLGALLFLRVL